MKSPYAYFKITEKAGRFVAGRNNTGVGTELLLSRREAEYEVALGTLVEVGVSAAQAPADDDQTTGTQEPVDLTKMTKDQLVALAEERGVGIDEKATKAQIIEALEAAAQAPAENG